VKKTTNFLRITAVLALYTLCFAGCEKEPGGVTTPITGGGGACTITITDIPSSYRTMQIQIISNIDPYPGIQAASGYNDVRNGKTTLPLYNQDMEEWSDVGEYYIVLDLTEVKRDENNIETYVEKTFVYTDGMPVPPMNNIKKCYIKDSDTWISFNKFQTDNTTPYTITIEDITENYNTKKGVVNVYNNRSEEIADGDADITDNKAVVKLHNKDIFHSGWEGGVQAAFTIRILGTTYVYTGGASLGSIGEEWGRAPKYGFPGASSTVNFSQFKTNDVVILPTRIIISGLDPKYNTDHFVSILLSSNSGYHPTNSIREYGDIQSGTAEIEISLPSDAGPRYIFLIVARKDKVLSGGIEFPKNVAVAAYQTETAREIITGMELIINSDFSSLPVNEIPNISEGEGD